MVDVQWGPEIPVDGKRPEWLRDDEAIGTSDGSRLFITHSCDRSIRWEGVACIRLPASHPHYAASQPYQAPKGASGYSEALIERMVALVAKIAVGDWVPGYAFETESEARAIVAEMEPVVDAALVEARVVAAGVYEAAGNTLSAENIRLGFRDEGMDVRIALAAIRRGRELERNAGGRDHD